MPLDPTKIRTRREALNLSQSAAALAAGISQPHWAKIETGHSKSTEVTTAEKIAVALKCSLDKILR